LVYLLVFHAYINEMYGSRSKAPSKKSLPYIYDVKFLALLGAPYICDISSLRIELEDMKIKIYFDVCTVHIVEFIIHPLVIIMPTYKKHQHRDYTYRSVQTVHTATKITTSMCCNYNI
jgi:hypothetical protein